MKKIDSVISIRTKLIFMVAGTLVLSIAVIAFLIRGLVYQNIVNQKMTTVDILSASIVSDIKYSYDVERRENVAHTIAKFMTYYRVIRNISFYDTQFRDRADSAPEHLGRITREPDILAAISTAKPSRRITRNDPNNLHIRSIEPILQGSRIIGAIAIDISIQDIETTLSAIDRRIALILLITVLLSSAAMFILLRSSILLRLNRLIKVTHEIAAGNYEIQVLDGRKDEIGNLARAFDQMTSDLRKSKQDIENYNKTLEERVREATSQLQNTYEDLKNAQSQMVLNEKMASLGVLTAGIAHEINTPLGAILNVSRHLDKKIRSLPQIVETYKTDRDIPGQNRVDCLDSLIETACNPKPSLSYKEIRVIETLLRDQGIENFREVTSHLIKLNVHDQDDILKYMDLFRIPSFFSLVESFGSIAQAATLAETSSQKVMEIVRALKYYSYTDKDKVEMIQINESIQASLVLCSNRVKHTIDVATEWAPDLPNIPCTSEINQIWTNLLNNACDAIEEMGEDYPGKIEIQTHHGDDEVRITIADNGAGIPEEKMDKIFDPFFTTKDIGKGTGLGLSIVSGILKKHHGTIGVTSRRGHTVFEIAIPVSPTFDPGKSTESHDEDPSKPSARIDAMTPSH